MFFNEFPYPDLKGYNRESLHLILGSIVLDEISRKYCERFINEPLRGYYHDQENVINSRSSSRSKSNIYPTGYKNTMDHI